MVELPGVFICSALIALAVAMILLLSYRTSFQSLKFSRSDVAKILIAAGIITAIVLFALPEVQ